MAQRPIQVRRDLKELRAQRDVLAHRAPKGSQVILAHKDSREYLV